ncbi:MAG: tetratricopeptide repeat protein [Bacteriovoracaceae bacterium]|nr:tetratricopeptide repeat protein [Bacteriovoracaceae bacterium]
MNVSSKLLIVVSLLFVFVSCKTSEEIKREKLVDTLSVQMVQSQRASADQSVYLQDFEEKIAKLSGQVELKTHENKKFQKTQKELIAVLQQNQSGLLKQVDEQKKQIQELEDKLEVQQEFISKVLDTLKKMNNKKVTKVSSSYDKAMKTYRSGKYKKAKQMLTKLSKSRKFKGNKMARILHNLGMSEYMIKNHSNAMIYFGRLLSKYPKSPFNPNGMLFLSKSLKRVGRKSEAKQTLEEVMERYPDSRSAKKAMIILKKMK